MRYKAKQFVSFVLYSKNLGGKVDYFVGGVNNFARDHFENYEIVLVDDASTDQTLSEIEKIATETNQKLILIRLAWPQGSDLAFMAGSDFAVGDFIYEIDLSKIDFEKKLLWDLYLKVCDGKDIVYAAPKTRFTPLLSRLFYRLFSTVSSLSFTLQTERARLMTRRALNSIAKIKDRGHYRKVLLKFSGYPDETIYYKPTRRLKEKKFSSNFSLALELMLTFSDLGIKISLWCAAIFFVFSLLLGLYALTYYFCLHTKVEGWTTIMVFLSFGFSGLFLISGLLTKYVALVLKEVKTSPHYVVKNISRLG